MLRMLEGDILRATVITDAIPRIVGNEVARAGAVDFAIRVDGSGNAVFERWAGGAWVEFGAGDSPVTAADTGHVELSLRCQDGPASDLQVAWDHLGDDAGFQP